MKVKKISRKTLKINKTRKNTRRRNTKRRNTKRRNYTKKKKTRILKGGANIEEIIRGLGLDPNDNDDPLVRELRSGNLVGTSDLAAERAADQEAAELAAKLAKDLQAAEELAKSFAEEDKAAELAPLAAAGGDQFEPEPESVPWTEASESEKTRAKQNPTDIISQTGNSERVFTCPYCKGIFLMSPQEEACKILRHGVTDMKGKKQCPPHMNEGDVKATIEKIRRENASLLDVYCFAPLQIQGDKLHIHPNEYNS